MAMIVVLVALASACVVALKKPWRGSRSGVAGR
jgi:hypothetical protein